jgi:CBS domain-containing protein
MRVADICVKEVIHTGKDTTTREAALIMRKAHVGDLIVTEMTSEGPIPVGIITDRDIVLSVVAPGLDANVITVGDVMRPELVTTREDEDFLDCMRLMRRKGVRRLPVVNERGALTGVITVDDLIHLMTEEMFELSELMTRERSKEVSTRL